MSWEVFYIHTLIRKLSLCTMSRSGQWGRGPHVTVQPYFAFCAKIRKMKRMCQVFH